MRFTVELQDKVATLEFEAAVLYQHKSKAPFLKDESFKLLKILTHKKFDNFPLSVLSFEFWNFLYWILPRHIQTGIVDDDNDDVDDDDVDKILCNISFNS